MPKQSPLLAIDHLSAGTPDQPIIRNLSLRLFPGQTHAIMGPNGSGKSSLANLLAGHPSYTPTQGQILFAGTDLLALTPTERAQKGLFLSFQQPPAIPGVSVVQFLRLARTSLDKTHGRSITDYAYFLREIRATLQQLGLPASFAGRAVNEGFSGGERKRLELLQMLILQPRLVILDEVDSGLDVDALSLVAQAVHTLATAQGPWPEPPAFLVITHYQRLLEYVVPDQVHILVDGQIVQSGKADLAKVVEQTGYRSYLQPSPPSDSPPHA